MLRHQNSWPCRTAQLFLLLGGVVLVMGLPKDEDYYTSMVGIQKLARKEQDIVASVLNYKTLLLERLSLVDNYLKEFESSLRPERKAHPLLSRAINKSKASSWSKDKPWLADIPIFKKERELEALEIYTSSNPIAAYKIIRRLAKELPELLNHFRTEIETEFVTLMDDVVDEIRIPNIEDLDGAANGLLRIQSTYAIPIDKFIDGDFGDPGPGLNSAYDLHYIGNMALKTGHSSLAVQWMEKALHRVTHLGDTSLPLTLVLGYLETAVTKHNEGQLSSNEDMAYMYFPHQLNTNLSRLVVPAKLANSFPPNLELVTGLEEDTHMDIWNFQALCGGRSLLTEEIRSQLFCYYKKDSALTFLSPVGVEVHSKKPPILQFYRILGNDLIKKIQHQASPHLLRARVVGTPENKDIKSDIRTSAVTWINEGAVRHSSLNKLPGLIKDLTGLDGRAGFSAEDLQISSYGAIGGHYQQHYDNLYDSEQFALDNQSPQERLRGDRIATMMFYLSDVRLGGGTAFPRVGVAATPAKGSAVFWYNLKRNGIKDKMSLHGGCPAGQGIKWVANKWIRSTGQMANRPCLLDPSL